MYENLIKLVSLIYDFLRNRRRAGLAVKVLSGFVVFVVTYLLILPAFTLDKNDAAKQGGIDLPVSHIEEENLLTYDGDGYVVTVDDKKSVLPEGTEVVAKAIKSDEDSKLYETLYDEALQAVKDKDAENLDISYALFYDISLISEGETIEPNKAVNVTISYDKAMQEQLPAYDPDAVSVIHFAEDKSTGEITTEVLRDDDVEIGTLKGQMTDTSFKAESFSVYAVVYTVDFSYSVNGQVYDFSLPGGETITLSKLIEVLGMLRETKFESVNAFLKEVEKVEFSDPSLVSVSKVEETTTVGTIKDRLGLVCEYSAELTEDEIAEINGSVVAAGDWALISLKPFTSEETLTVKMVNGDEFVIRVTDAQYAFHIRINDENAGYFNGQHATNTNFASYLTRYTNSQDQVIGIDIPAGFNGGGSEGTATTITRGTVANANSGYTFLYWLKDGEKITTSKTLDGKTSLTQESTFTAVFTRNGQYVVRYTTDGNGAVDKVSSYSGDSEGASALANTGYVFDGWYNGDTLVSSEITVPATVLSSITNNDTVLTAKFREAEQYTYTYGKAGTLNNTVVSPASEIVVEGQIAEGATASTNNRTDRWFVAWMDEDTGELISTNNILTFSETASKDRHIIGLFSSGSGKRILAYGATPGTVSWPTNGANQALDSKYLAGYLNLSNTITMTFASGYEYDYATLNGAVVDANTAYVSKTSTAYQIRNYIDNNAQNGLNIFVVYTRPINTYKITYAADGPGTVSNTTDYAGSADAVGSTATPGSGQHFLGWYFSDGNLALSTETITANDLIGWKNEGKIHEGDTLTARFGAGYTITYKKQINDESPEEISSELVTSSAPDGCEADALTGYNFLGWYKGEELVTINAKLSATDIGSVTSDMTFTAKYATTYVAAYEVEHMGAAKQGVSTYGQVVVGSESTTSSATQNANNENVLTSGATAIPARGCDFVGWEVTENGTVLSGSRVQEQYGFDVSSSSIPAGIEIGNNVTFKAKFQKQSGTMEIIYTIQEDEDPSSHAAKLTVAGRSVEGYGSVTAYISEVVPAGAAALGCAAEGLNYSGQDYKIRGWVLGDDNDPKYNKDTLFTRNSSFTPVGEYLDDIDGTGVRYYRVVTKKKKNVYIMFRVNIIGAGNIKHGTGDVNREDVLIYINSEGLDPIKSYDAVFNSESSGQAVNYYGVYASPGYKLVGFTFNDVVLDLETAIDPSGKKIAKDNYKVLDPETNNYVDLVEYMNGHSKLYLPSSDAVVNENEHVNILIARYEIEGYNIEYHVKDGIGGSVSNNADAYTSLEKENGKKTDESDLIKGSTAVADTGADYVFVRWEDEEGSTVSVESKFAPRVDDITDTNKTYHYYAVFEQRKRLNVLYEPDDPSHGVTNPGSETVHQGVPANGSLATAYEGYVFTHWTREGSTETISTDPNFIPNIYGVSDEDTDHVTATDFAAEQTVKFIAHFRTEIDSKITISKVVNVKDGLSKEDVDTVIYIGLTRNGVDVNDRNGQPLIKEIVVKDGEAQNAVTFDGLPYNDISNSSDRYEVWEMHKVGSVYERQYVGMLIGDDYQLSAISASNNSAVTSREGDVTFADGSGNNAIITESHKEANVTLTNTYSKETDVVSFEVNKEWQDSDGQKLTGENIPAGARVEMTVYSENDGVTRAVKSIWLDGQTDENGEGTAWKATFSNLPKFASNGTELTYKVRETGLWEGYKPYINSGSTYLSENLYLYNSGGKIVNKADKENTALITVRKVDKKDETKLLSGAAFNLTKKNERNGYKLFNDGSHPEGIYRVGGEGDGLGLFSVALPDGEYKIQETTSPDGYVIVSSAFEFAIENGELTGTDGEFISFDSSNKMITIKNEAGAALPSTGGPGTGLYTILGSLLTGFAGAWLLISMKRRTA